MCRWLAYVGRERPLETLIYEKSHSLVHQSQHSVKAKLGVHGDGVGIAWYGNICEPGLYRDPTPAWSNPNLLDLCHQLSSRLFFAHIRASTGTPSIHLNCHPFRFRNWIFMHNGQIGGFESLRRPLEGLLCDESYGMRRGATDSELMFLLSMSAGLANNLPEGLRRMFSLIEEKRCRHDITDPVKSTIAIADGNSVWALRWSSNNQSPSLYLKREESGLILVSEPLDEELDSWREIDENTLLQLRFDDTEGPTILEERFF